MSSRLRRDLSSRETVPVLRSFASIPPIAVRWLWRGYIPRDAFTLLDGRPGQGKSTIALDIAARVSRGLPMPDGTDGVKGDVVYLSREDDPATTLVPRAMAAGADMERLWLLDGRATLTTENGEAKTGATEPVTMQDLQTLRSVVEDKHAVLMVIDPVQSYLGAGVDAHRAEEVRPVLDGIGTLARETGCAVLVLRHLRKSAADSALDRGWGSIDFGAAARSELLAGADPADESSRALVGVKYSLAAEPTAIGYSITSATIGNGIDTSRINWTGATELNRAALLGPEPVPERPGRLDKAVASAEEWLRGALVGRSGRTWDDLTRAGWEDGGHREATLRRARTSIGCHGGWRGRDYLWSLPITEHTNGENTHGTEVEQDEQDGVGLTPPTPENLAQPENVEQDSNPNGHMAGGHLAHLAQPTPHGGSRPVEADRRSPAEDADEAAYLTAERAAMQDDAVVDGGA